MWCSPTLYPTVRAVIIPWRVCKLQTANSRRNIEGEKQDRADYLGERERKRIDSRSGEQCGRDVEEKNVWAPLDIDMGIENQLAGDCDRCGTESYIRR